MVSRSVRFTDPPSSPAQLAADPPDREAAESADLTVETVLDIPSEDADVERSAVTARTVESDGSENMAASSELRITYRPSRIGQRVMPPPVPVEVLDPPDAAVVAEEEARLLDAVGGDETELTPDQLAELEAAIARRVAALPRLTTNASAPAHLPVRTVPESVPESLATARYPDVLLAPSGQAPQPTTMFPPENRQVLWDTAYPWGCNGRVTTSRGSGSGCLVGPRHLLTCSHVVAWNADGSAGWLDFVPGYFDRPPGPFGTARAIRIYSYVKVTPPLDTNELRHDYVVVVLDWRIGDRAGWLGSKSYVDGWDGQAWWTHVGYPTDFGGHRPTWQGGISFDGDNNQPDANQSIYHWGDVATGQSGGAFWAWWNGTPHAVAVQSAHDSGKNWASGGSFIPNLINQVRTAFP